MVTGSWRMAVVLTVLTVVSSACTPFVWGLNTDGQLGLGTSLVQATNPLPLGGQPQGDWVDLGSAIDHTCGVRLHGSLWCWGDNTYGQLGDGTTTDATEPTRAGAPTDDWDAVDSGTAHSCAIHVDRSLWCWGDNSFGQLGDGTTTGRSSPTQVGTATDWIDIATGGFHTCGIREVTSSGAGSGRLYCWGDNWAGQVGDSSTTTRLSPTEVSEGGGTTWRSVALGDTHSCGIFTFNLYCWGSNGQGQLGGGFTVPSVNRPRPVDFCCSPATPFFKNVSVGGYHTCAVTANVPAFSSVEGRLFCAGLNSDGQLGNGTTVDADEMTQVGTATDWDRPILGGQHSCATRENGSLWCWGNNGNGQLGDGTTTGSTAPGLVAATGNWIGGDGGFFHTCARQTDDSLWCWGGNGQGQVGNGTTTDQLFPDPIEPTILSVTAGDAHSCRIEIDRTLWCWGDSDNGQVGDGAAVDRFEPVAIGTARNWSVVSGGGDHTCALRTDTSLWCWGDDARGQLGDSVLLIDQSSPVQVSTGWTMVSAGTRHTCGVRTDATLWCWGENQSYQLGLGDQSVRTLPAQVGTDADWREVHAGRDHTCALRTDRSLWCWGLDAFGQVGNGLGGNVFEPAPVAVATGSTWKNLASGHDHSCARRSDNTLWCWGSGFSGRLGDGTATSRGVPTQVGADSDWQNVTAGAQHTCGIRTGQTLWCWGENGNGQVGDNTTFDRLVPTAVFGGGRWSMVDGGGTHTVAVDL